MVYYPIEDVKPDPTNASDGMGDMQDYIRRNILALRDTVAGGTGFVYGWDGESQNTNGSTPPTDPTMPDQIVYSRTIASTLYSLRVRFTYYTSGAAEDQVETIISHFKVGAGSWDLIADTDYPLGTCTVTYDSNGDYLSHAWT